MKKTLLASLATCMAALGGFIATAVMGPPMKRARTCDIAFGYRMGAGFPGDVNRTHPASILAVMTNLANPPVAYGGPVFVNTITSSDSTIRGTVAADGSVTPLAVYGFLVRPFPVQQTTGGMNASIGAATPPTSGVQDVLRQGYIMAKLPAGATVVKGGTVYAWVAATSGNSIQGQLVAAASGTNTITINNAYFVGPADANGNVEVEVRAA